MFISIELCRKYLNEWIWVYGVANGIYSLNGNPKEALEGHFEKGVFLSVLFRTGDCIFNIYFITDIIFRGSLGRRYPIRYSVSIYIVCL